MKDWLFGGVPAVAGWFVRIVAVTLFAGLAGCAAQTGSVEAAAKNRETIVMERSQARWDALLKDQMAEAYKFYSPSSRAVLSYEDFVRSIRAGFWKSARVEKVECEAEDVCEAIVAIEYSYRGGPFRTPIRETWIRIEEQWWYVKKG